MEVIAPITKPKAYNAVGEASLSEVGSHIPFVLVRKPYQIAEIVAGSTHENAEKKAIGTLLGGGVVARERNGKLGLLGRHSKLGALPEELCEQVRTIMGRILGEEITIIQESDFKGRPREK